MVPSGGSRNLQDQTRLQKPNKVQGTDEIYGGRKTETHKPFPASGLGGNQSGTAAKRKAWRGEKRKDDRKEEGKFVSTWAFDYVVKKGPDKNCA